LSIFGTAVARLFGGGVVSVDGREILASKEASYSKGDPEAR